MNGRSRPKAAPKTPGKASATSVQPAADRTREDSNTHAYALVRVRFAEQFGEIPVYGSSEWLSLPADDPRKAASVWRAAEAWRSWHEPAEIAERLRCARESQQALDEADWRPVAEYVRRMAEQPTQDELQRRRGWVA